MPRFFALLLAAAALWPLAARPAGEPPVVTTLDLVRYQGRWYEIASFPNRFQRGCHATTADYRLRDDGRVAVLNRCRRGAPDGEATEAEGWARVAAPGRLRVTFFWPFFGDYWVLGLDPDYQWALVGTPDRDYLWVLARTPVLDPAVYGRIVARAAELGFDTARLQRTWQPGEPS